MNKLEEFVEFEQSVCDIQLSKIEFNIQFVKPTQGAVSIKEIVKTKIIFTVNDQEYFGMLDRVIIHQLGKRMFEDKLTDAVKNEYYPVFNEWFRMMAENENDLIHRIKHTIIRDELIMRYIPSKRNKIYGFISSKFEFTDQLSFRKNLLQSEVSKKYLDIESPKMYHVNKGVVSSPVKEYFEFNFENSEVKLSCGITYGMNNGYGAYGVHWVRRIPSTDTWLSPIKGGFSAQSEVLFKWKNNPRNHEGSTSEELNKFLNGIVEEGKRIIEETAQIIRFSKEESISQLQVEEMLKLLKVSYATKDRVRECFVNDMHNHPNTLFKFSEAIRFIGTFDKFTPQATKRLLIEVGTNILVKKELNHIIQKGEEIVLKGGYDWY